MMQPQNFGFDLKQFVKVLVSFKNDFRENVKIILWSLTFF